MIWPIIFRDEGNIIECIMSYIQVKRVLFIQNSLRPVLINFNVDEICILNSQLYSSILSVLLLYI